MHIKTLIPQVSAVIDPVFTSIQDHMFTKRPHIKVGYVGSNLGKCFGIRQPDAFIGLYSFNCSHLAFLLTQTIM